jgi:hypothetical protein
MLTSPERRLRAVPPTSPAASPGVDARLASLEEEARRLRAEIAALQDDLRWLSGADDEAEAGWLARGWVRASLLLATVGVVAIVSLPYLLHHDLPEPTPAPVAARPAPAARNAAAVPAAVKARAARESIPAPIRVRASAASAPVVAADDRPVPETRAATTDAAVFTPPLSHDGSP